MSFYTETGYTVPGGDLSLEHARILHGGNRFQIKTITASDEIAGSPKEAVDNALTFEKWKPFANAITEASDLSATDWTATRFIVAADGQSLDEGTDAATTRLVSQAMTFTAETWVVSFRVERQTMDGLRVQANDGTTDFYADFDLRDGSVDFEFTGTTAAIYDLGENAFELRIFFTPVAGTGFVRVMGWDATASDVTYTGTSRTVKVMRAVAHVSAANIRLDGFTAAAGDMFAIAGHNLGTGQARISFEHDSNNDGTFTLIDRVTPSDDSPIMFLFAPVTSSRWRITVDRGALPEIAVVRIGSALQMQRPIFQGVRPLETNRIVTVRGNISESGEWLGRSRVRNYLSGAFEFIQLTPAWVRANIGGARGMLQSIEVEPFFIAWRPDKYDDAHYCWTTGDVAGPVFNQKPNLMGWSVAVEALGYE